MVNKSNIKSIKCTLCKSDKMLEIIDFGNVGLAGAFLKKKEIKSEKKYRMRLCLCRQCFLLQIHDKINPKILFRDYFYFSSAIQTLRIHFAELAKEVHEMLKNKKSQNVLEFGCNDGILLKPLISSRINNLIGVDPASNIIKTVKHKKINIINDFFNFKLSQSIRKKYGKMNVILANNVFAHISDLNNTTRAIKYLLESEGSFIFEVHYLGKMINEVQYDMVYHEHIFYHSLLSLSSHFNRYGLAIYDVKAIDIHAGSMRYYVCHNKSILSNKKTKRVTELLNKELKNQFNKSKIFLNFSKKIQKSREDLLALMKKIKKNNEIVYGYGASGRANTILQYCNLSRDEVPYIIDDSIAKHGFYTPGSHIKICSANILKSDEKPDYILLFAWSFLKEIVFKNKKFLELGGKIILPLPKVKVVGLKEVKKFFLKN